ncbi:MAG: hypothetical protein HKN78_07075 [Sphingomonadaceae bacterium]|nr:hypothetical protein [Sphingomonadaceae bacterium]
MSNPLPDNRKSPRLPLVTEVELFAGLRKIGTARIFNISAHGAGGATSAQLAQGQRIGIALNSAGTVPAIVIWKEGACFGASFKSPIDPVEVDVMLDGSDQWSTPPSAAGEGRWV